MELAFTEEQNLFRNSVERFLQNEYGFDQRRASLARDDGIDPEIWSGFADLGIFSLAIAESDGGLGYGMLEFGLVMEALGRHLVVEPVLTAAFQCGQILSRAADDKQRTRWLPPLLDGTTRFAFCHDPRAPALCRHDRTWRIDGCISRVGAAIGADHTIVAACDPENHLRLFLVSAKSAGLTVMPQRLLDSSRAACLTFESVAVPDANVMSDDAGALISDVIDKSVIAACWEATGAMTAAYEQTVTYVKQREQFGRPIAAFQVVQHAIAEMAVCCQEARAVSMLAALSSGSGIKPQSRAVSAAKVKVGLCADLVAKHSVQLHGGMGVAEELPIASYFRKLTAFQILLGSTSYHRSRYADQVVMPRLHETSAILPASPCEPGCIPVTGQD